MWEFAGDARSERFLVIAYATPGNSDDGAVWLGDHLPRNRALNRVWLYLARP